MDVQFIKLSPIHSEGSEGSNTSGTEDSQPSAPSGTDSASSTSTPPMKSSPEPCTHNTTLAKYHVKDVEEFAKTLDTAAIRAFPSRSRIRYNDVQVLLLRWEEDELEVEWELNDLAAVFRDYGFDTETWLIPTAAPYRKLMTKAGKFVEDHENEDTLFIVYYGGHANINQSRQSTWSCKRDVRYSTLDWSGCLSLFEESKSDVLFLLDCCSAAAAAPSTARQPSSIIETIAACGWETWAPEPGRHSFTNALIEVLEDWKGRTSFSTAMIHSEVLSILKHPRPKGNKEYCRTPVYVVTTGNPKSHSIEIACRRRPPQACESPKTNPSSKSESSSTETPPPVPTTDSDQFDLASLVATLPDKTFVLPHVLMAVALEEDQMLDVKGFSRWLEEFPALAKCVKIQGVYQSYSTLVLVTVPVAIWDMLPQDLAWNFVGYAKSDNLWPNNLGQRHCQSVSPPISSAELGTFRADPYDARRILTSSVDTVLSTKKPNNDNILWQAHYFDGFQHQVDDDSGFDSGSTYQAPSSSIYSSRYSSRESQHNEDSDRRLETRLKTTVKSDPRLPNPTNLSRHEVIRISDDVVISNFYFIRFRELQQPACKLMVKTFVNFIESKVQSNHLFDKGTGEIPPWWLENIGESSVRYLEVALLPNNDCTERILLLVHILNMVIDANHGGTSTVEELGLDVTDLENATMDALHDWFNDKDHPENNYKRYLLCAIFKVARIQERFKRGEIDAETFIPVIGGELSRSESLEEKAVEEASISGLKEKDQSSRTVDKTPHEFLVLPEELPTISAQDNIDDNDDLHVKDIAMVVGAAFRSETYQGINDEDLRHLGRKIALTLNISRESFNRGQREQIGSGSK